MKDGERLKANSILSKYITLAMAEIHGQAVGIRVTELTTDVQNLNPPGYGYGIRANVQVTLVRPNEKETPN